MLEEIEELLEFGLLERAVYSWIELFITMSMYMTDGKLVIVEFKIVAE